MFSSIKSVLLDPIRPSFWNPEDYSYVWLYVFICILAYIAIHKFKKFYIKSHIMAKNRIAYHAENIRLMREKEKEKLLERSSGSPLEKPVLIEENVRRSISSQSFKED